MRIYLACKIFQSSYYKRREEEEEEEGKSQKKAVVAKGGKLEDGRGMGPMEHRATLRKW